MLHAPLLERYALKLNLSPETARHQLFLECVPRWQRGFVRLHSWLRPGLYAGDRRLLHEAGQATNLQAVTNALDRWQHSAAGFRSFSRERLHWRISGRRLVAVARDLLTAGQPSTPPALSPLPRTNATIPPARPRGLLTDNGPGLSNSWIVYG